MIKRSQDKESCHAANKVTLPRPAAPPTAVVTPNSTPATTNKSVVAPGTQSISFKSLMPDDSASSMWSAALEEAQQELRYSQWKMWENNSKRDRCKLLKDKKPGRLVERHMVLQTASTNIISGTSRSKTSLALLCPGHNKSASSSPHKKQKWTLKNAFQSIFRRREKKHSVGECEKDELEHTESTIMTEHEESL
ncbi:expressed unknown protein [Seminavis robusta]|uniref:Uncharacterized protein n=1 Tax=Seminavis robusta TaxID=568900 RepID=A0A9N8ETZ6_9STRA|nr:expressed unknown protein [Seminavis robusta]|eukprot:Sro1946_g307080.1 n/a (194) ;mRNA; f:17132-17713